MLRIMKVRINIKEDVCLVVDAEQHSPLHTIYLRDDLRKALGLLKKINALVTTTGEPIYAVRMVGGVSAWSFHQHVLFWEYLRHFVYFEELVKILLEKSYVVVLDQNTDSRLASLCALIGVQTSFEGVWSLRYLVSQLRIVVANWVCGLIARLIGFVSVLLALALKKTTLVYSPDKFDSKFGGDFRLQEMYRFFRDTHIQYIEIFHTTLGRSFLKNIFSRKRGGLYREYLPFAIKDSPLIHKEFSPVVSGFEPHQDTYITNVLKHIDRSSVLSVLLVLTLERYIRWMRIERLITVDDMRSAQEIITACKMLEIPTYGFQHGHINLYHTGLMNYGIPLELSTPFDFLYVWNPYWLEKLTSHSSMYTTSNVFVGGYLRPPKFIDFSNRHKKIPNSPSELSVLIANDTWAPKNEVREYVRRILDLGCMLYVGIRPDVSLSKQLSEFGVERNDPRVFLCVGADPEVIQKVDCVIGVYSTFLYEMMNYDLPIFVMDTTFTFGEDLIIDDLAYLLPKDFVFDDFKQYLVSFKSKKDIIWPKQNQTVQNTLHSIYEKNL